MADVFDISEVREVVSVLYDQLNVIEFTLSSVTEDKLAEMVDSVRNGEQLVLGQLVNIVSTNGSSILGQLPAIVTAIKRVAIDNYEYKLTQLTGDFNDELTDTIIPSSKVKDTIRIDMDMKDVIDYIKDKKIGENSFRDLKIKKGIPHIFIYNADNSNFDSII
jgi:hypothetical protein